MLKIEYQGQFKKDYKVALKRGCNQQLLADVIAMLANEQELPEKYRDHSLTNSRRYKDARECHLQPDWLLVYQISKDILTLKLLRTGSHSDLF
ncbi:type II toxin-antitoxin system YafQ family toxin [Lachnoclostridium pacaense]|uniref:type II toxin-antitoxin system RelE/ParE family toxin n=1 Tax=Enterocloster hominis (ex Hitch et al. 2024) TaxID=1917870 RepID=UPI001D0F6150|nr:type II toxin-antitoxin system YafQ family toxin [Lachnoclostridium pacaense]MCC2821038.1 type II toxin-antitoxin system YafQ family toxin [Lachnoclostridium pacaense]